MPPRAPALPLLPLFLSACAASAPPPAPSPLLPPPASAAAPPASDPASDVKRLLLDTAGSDACSKLRGKFVGLPAPSPLEGADAGLAKTAGRWWIRACTSASDGATLKLRLAGPGWSWVDQTSSGFRVAQYVYFAVDAELSGTLDVGYDPSARIASIWLLPAAGANARVEPLSDVNAKADTLFSGALVAGTLGLMGKVADDAAKRQVGTQGAEQFQKRLSDGATITLDMARGQLDLSMGRLPKGVVPKRPFADGAPWLLNERQELHPGGLQVAGPFDPAATVLLDATIENGPGLAWRVVCRADAEAAFDAVARGGSPALPPFEPGLGGAVTTTTTSSVVIHPPGCPFSLVTGTAGAAPSDVALRLRTDAEAAPPPRAVESAVVKVTLVSYSIEPKRPNGDAWDAFGGAPDPKVWLATPRVRHVLVKTASDTFTATPTATAPEPIELTRTAGFTIGADDEDTAFDDPIGTAAVTLDDVLGHDGDFDVPLKAGGARTGTVRLHVEVLAKR